VLWGSSGSTRFDPCPGAPRKPRVERVLECVGAFFDSSEPRHSYKNAPAIQDIPTAPLADRFTP